jgi:excisionase family DNA binding protein
LPFLRYGWTMKPHAELARSKLMTSMTPALTPEEERLIREALPGVRRSSPRAATAIARLVRAAASLRSAPAAAKYVSVREVAEVFEVTGQTIRNWVDRGWLPAERHLGRGPRRIPRSVLASATALARPRPQRKKPLTPAELDELTNRPRRQA